MPIILQNYKKKHPIHQRTKNIQFKKKIKTELPGKKFSKPYSLWGGLGGFFLW